MTEELIEIEVDGEKKMINARAITLLCSNGNISFKYPNHLALDSTATIYHIQNVKELHPAFLIMWQATILDVKDHEQTSESLKRHGTGYQHLAGLIDLTLKLIDVGVPFVWVHPESHLHPRLQGQLADLAVKFSKYTMLSPEQLLTCDDEALRKAQSVRPVYDKEAFRRNAIARAKSQQV